MSRRRRPAADGRAADACLVAGDFFEFGVQFEDDFPGGDLFVQLVNQDFFGAEAVAAVDEGDGLREVGEVERFFNGGVAAADNRDRFVAVEEAVAGGTGRDAAPLVGFFGGQAEVFGARAGGNDDGFGAVCFVARFDVERPDAEVCFGDEVAHDAGLEAFGVGAHIVHQHRPLDTFCRAGPVIDVGGGHQLPALFQSGDEDGFKSGAGGVNGSGVASRAGADDEDFASGHAVFLLNFKVNRGRLQGGDFTALRKAGKH